MASDPAIVPSTISPSQRRPFAIAMSSVSRVSDLMGGMQIVWAARSSRDSERQKPAARDLDGIGLPIGSAPDLPRFAVETRCSVNLCCAASNTSRSRIERCSALWSGRWRAHLLASAWSSGHFRLPNQDAGTRWRCTWHVRFQAGGLCSVAAQIVPTPGIPAPRGRACGAGSRDGAGQIQRRRRASGGRSPRRSHGRRE